MSRSSISTTQSFALFAGLGAFLGGLIAWLFAPGLFWAALLCGAMSFAAARVGYVIFAVGDSK